LTASVNKTGTPALLPFHKTGPTDPNYCQERDAPQS
jgi:hypothetical protein